MRTNLQKELAADIGRETFDLTEEGINFPRQSVLVSGEYFDRINGGAWSVEKNLLPVPSKQKKPRRQRGKGFSGPPF